LDVLTDIAIVGGGIVGLATGAVLAQSLALSTNADFQIVLLEKESHCMQHASSRNSEVIHAGLYYPADSLKTRLCLRGKYWLLKFCRTHGISHEQCGKWIVANSDNLIRLNQLREHAQKMGIPIEWISETLARQQQPNLANHIKHVLHSPTTGIISSHEYSQKLMEILEHGGNNVRVEPQSEVAHAWWDPASERYCLEVKDPQNLRPSWRLGARRVINCTGVWADTLSPTTQRNGHFPAPWSQIRVYPSRGHYFKLAHPQRHPKFTRLIYPIPDANVTSLGIHLTMDLQGAVKFGPNVEFVSPDKREAYTLPSNLMDVKHQFYESIAQYLDGISVDDLDYDYCGIRAKITPPGTPQRDFLIERGDSLGFPNWIQCMGIESPGLTSSLAIAEHIASMYHIEVDMKKICGY
jgi:L-2-hydroxyglutarate oxidase LhgO